MSIVNTEVSGGMNHNEEYHAAPRGVPRMSDEVAKADEPKEGTYSEAKFK